MAIAVSDADLIDHLREHLGFLRSSAGAFDAGTEGEAKRLALSLRVLLHDTRASHSVLDQLGIKDEVFFVNTADPINPRNRVGTPGLVIMEVTTGEGGSYVAPLGDLPPSRQRPPVRFTSWWGDPVTQLSDGVTLSRKDYVLTVANKEGGAHVDVELDADWIRLTRENALGAMYFEERARVVEVEKPFDRNPALASVRQITHEFFETVEEQLDIDASDRTDLLRAGRYIEVPATTGRNDPCPCGSGKKYKKCHGA